MEQGLTVFFKERNYTLGSRKVELHTADTGGNPAQTRTKTQELVERFNVHCLIGPLAAFEALAIDDYIRSSQDPDPHRRGRRGHDAAQAEPVAGSAKLDLRAAEPSDGRFRGEGFEVQARDPIADDFAFGHENAAGFQRAFEDAGGKVVQKLFTPLNAPDYGTYVSQFKNADCLYTGHAGSNGLKLIRQISEYGLKGKFTIVGGFTPIDELVLQQMGEDGVGATQAAGTRPRSITRSTRSSSKRSSATTRSIPACTRRRPTFAAKYSNTP